VPSTKLILLLTCYSALGCSFGPHALTTSHGRYNDAFRRVDAEELLVNIVRLRYGDPPAEVEVSNIAAQFELSAQAEGRPFFGVESQVNDFRSFSSVLPFLQAGGSTRPTISYTPIHSGETVARYLRPITSEEVMFLAGASWPVSSIFRLWLEGMNGLPNAPSASGPTRGFSPEYKKFLQVCMLLQVIQDRDELTFRKCEVETVGDPIATDKVSGEALVEAKKVGSEYRATDDGRAWRLVSKASRLYMDLSPRALGTPEYAELVSLLNLKPGLTRYEIVQSTIGFIEQRPDAPPSDKLVFVTRSLIQVFFYLSHGVQIPLEHLASGVARTTLEPDGRFFDWSQVVGGLFEIKSCSSKKPPACAAVAVRYRGYWFYIEDSDHATKATFLLMGPSRELDFGASVRSRDGAKPLLTLPVGR